MELPAEFPCRTGTLPQGVSVGPAGTVERLGQDAGRGGLAHAARPRKDIAVRHALGANGVLQRVGDQMLADYIVKDAGRYLRAMTW